MTCWSTDRPNKKREGLGLACLEHGQGDKDREQKKKEKAADRCRCRGLPVSRYLGTRYEVRSQS